MVVPVVVVVDGWQAAHLWNPARRVHKHLGSRQSGQKRARELLTRRAMAARCGWKPGVSDQIWPPKGASCRCSRNRQTVVVEVPRRRMEANEQRAVECVDGWRMDGWMDRYDG